VKAALITGGGTGIGAATALELARRGYAVAVSGRRPEPLRDVAAEVAAAGGQAIAVAGDTADPADAERVVAAAVEAFGGLDLTVPNAGISRSGSVLTQTPEGWDEVLRTNVTGAFLICRAALPHLIERRGAIVAVSSAAAFQSGPESVAYCTSKAALVMLVQCLAVDFGPQGVRANAVCPAWVRTPMADALMQDLGEQHGTDREGGYRIANADVPLRRAATPQEVADAIAWLASPEAGYVNGVALSLDGGARVVDLGLLPFSRQPTP
jgi:meso-butanediol dehydrogenase / (S,S)-butanediol dehydrogenase / diacetyl reductase